MDKKKWSILLAIFFLVQEANIPLLFSAVNYPLLPQMKTDPASPDIVFKNIYDSIRFAVEVYKLDAIEHCPKAEIIKRAGTTSLNPSIRFDLENIDMVKKGWTRYYPFSIEGKDFIMRIFLTSEKNYQTEAPILYEGNLANPAITFQVLPSLNEILSGCKIAPHRTYSTRQVDSSS